MRRNPRDFIRKARSLRNERKEIEERVVNQHNTNVFIARAQDYASYRKKRKVDERTILYESYWGKGLIDNPYAIFRYLLDNPAYKGYKHIWSISDFESNKLLIERYASYNNVSFVEVHSNEYYAALASAKYLINNVTFPYYFVKKPEQVYVNTWHGTPLKAMGYESERGNSETANTMRNFLETDYLISANEVMTSMYLDSYKLRDIMPGVVLEEGYPRNDLLFSTPRDDIAGKLRDFGIELEEGKELILYAPTWRQGSSSKAVIDPEGLLMVKRRLEEHLGTEHYQILIKPHQYVYEALKDNEAYRGLLVPSMLDTNEILSVVDILVSDYSSIFFDFMALGRPVIFYITDAERYAQERGLKYSLDELPGPYSDDLDQVARYIAHIDETKAHYAEAYAAVRDKVTRHDDGHASERVVRAAFESDTTGMQVFYASHEKKRLLISVGALYNNGIVHSLMSLLRQVDYDEWDVTLYATVLDNDPEMQRKLNEDVDPHVRALKRVGGVVNTVEEQVTREFVELRGLYRKTWRALYPDEVLDIEFKRAFGYAQYDYIVDFCGYGRFHVPLMLKGEAKKKSIWLHNDIKDDMNKTVNGDKPTYVGLHLAISLYPEFDNLVSCGKSVCEVNARKLGTPETIHKFKYAKNTIDVDRFERCMRDEEVFTVAGRTYILTQAFGRGASSGIADFVELPDGSATSFVTMGRMSTEKNHARLIKAFARYVDEQPSAKLYIIGSGPLEADLRALIGKLKLQDSVILTGNLKNPFSLMRRCDCFILPSIHEGQPLVLLEARMCGLPIIVSDFSSVKDSLLPHGQLLIEPTVEGILEGLRAYDRGEVGVVPFDATEYNREAYQEFIDAIM